MAPMPGKELTFENGTIRDAPPDDHDHDEADNGEDT